MKSVNLNVRLEQRVLSRRHRSTMAGPAVLIVDVGGAHPAAGATTGITTGTLPGDCAKWLGLRLLFSTRGTARRIEARSYQALGTITQPIGYWALESTGLNGIFRKDVGDGSFRYGRSTFMISYSLAQGLRVFSWVPKVCFYIPRDG